MSDLEHFNCLINMKNKNQFQCLKMLAVTIMVTVVIFSCTDENIEEGTEQIKLNYTDSLKVAYPSNLYLIIKDSTSNLQKFPAEFVLVRSDNEDSLNIRYTYSQSSYWSAPAFRLKKTTIQDTIVLYFEFVLFDELPLQKRQSDKLVNSINTSPLPNTYSIDKIEICNKNVHGLTVLNRLKSTW